MIGFSIESLMNNLMDKNCVMFCGAATVKVLPNAYCWQILAVVDLQHNVLAVYLVSEKPQIDP